MISYLPRSVRVAVSGGRTSGAEMSCCSSRSIGGCFACCSPCRGPWATATNFFRATTSRSNAVRFPAVANRRCQDETVGIATEGVGSVNTLLVFATEAVGTTLGRNRRAGASGRQCTGDKKQRLQTRVGRCDAIAKGYSAQVRAGALRILNLTELVDPPRRASHRPELSRAPTRLRLDRDRSRPAVRDLDLHSVMTKATRVPSAWC